MLQRSKQHYLGSKHCRVKTFDVKRGRNDELVWTVVVESYPVEVEDDLNSDATIRLKKYLRKYKGKL